MAWYRTGTISVTNGSKNVTGANTAFIANVGIGEALLGPDGAIYEIETVSSDTALALKTVYAGTSVSSQAYAIHPSQSYIRDLAAQAATVINSYADVAADAAAAAASATAAAASYDAFDDRYLGSKTADPTLDNDGNALITGALYFNSTVGELRVYGGAAWSSTSVAPQIVAAAAKATPIDADSLGIVDSAAGNALKETTFAQLWTWIKSKIESVTLAVTLSGGSINNAPVGNTTPSTGAFTTLDVNGNISLSGAGTANRYVALLGETGTYAGTFMLQAGGGSAAYGGAVVMYGHSHALHPGSVYIGGSSGSSGSIIFGGGGNSGPGGSEWARLTDTGLGIGTSSPNARLHVALTGASTASIVNVGSFGAAGIVSLGGVAANSEAVYLGTGDAAAGGIAAGIGFMREASGWNSALAFYTNNVTAGPNGVSALQEKMRLTSSGNLGIGVTPSAWGSNYRAMQVGATASLWSGATGELAAVTSNSYFDGANNKRLIAGASSQLSMSSSNFTLETASSGSAGTTITYTQTLAVGLDTSVALQGATSQSGTGITFPATKNASSNANTLDDYEEYTAASTACTGAITTAVAWKVTKIGNQVTLTLPPTYGIASLATYFEYGVALPAAFRPAENIIFPCSIKNADANMATPGMVFIFTTGVIRVYRDMTAATDFTAGVTAGLGQSAGIGVAWTI